MGGSHIAIPTILKVGKGTLENLGTYIKSSGMSNAVIYFGNDLIDMFGETVMKSLKDAGVNVLGYREMDSIKIEELIGIAFDIDSKAQVVVGIGGGKVIDGAKYGFSSASASLLVNGRRTSVPARMAYGIVADTQIIKSAPEKFIYSGIGDMVSKITALYDWVYEDQKGYTELNDFAMMIAKKAVNSFVRTPFESIKDDLFLKELLDSLAMSGIANEIAGGSAPTSGSEHLISHALDKMLPVPQLHGVQVGIATYLMSVVQNHRYKRVNIIFTDTGFWNFVEKLDLDIKDYEKAIDMAPSIKPHRHTYLHEKEYRDLAKKVLYEDERLKKVFHI